jgi:nicotinamide riboside kinase
MKIAFCGSHGTGKSTLMNELAKLSVFHNYTFIDSISRNLPKGWKDKRSQAYVNNRYLYKHLFYRNFVSARSFYDAWAYSLENVGLTFHFCRFNMGIHLIKYDFLFYIPIEFNIIDDNYRPIDTEYQKKIDTNLLKLLTYANIPFYTITGSVEQRLTQIRDIIKI